MTAPRPDDPDAFFRKYSIALKMWCRKFNTAEIAAHLDEQEHVVQRWIWHWRELSKGGVMRRPLSTIAFSHVAATSSRAHARVWPGHPHYQTFPQVQV